MRTIKNGLFSFSNSLLKRTIYYPKQLLWFIVLHFCIDVHSCFAVFVSGKVLDGLWINTSIEKIGNVSVPQLMRGYIKVQRISDFGLIFLGHAQRWGNRVFDALPIHILIIVPGLSGADNDILPHSLKPRSNQRLPLCCQQSHNLIWNFLSFLSDNPPNTSVSEYPFLPPESLAP